MRGAGWFTIVAMWHKMAIDMQTSVMSTVGVETVAAFLSRKFTSRACRGRRKLDHSGRSRKLVTR